MTLTILLWLMTPYQKHSKPKSCKILIPAVYTSSFHAFIHVWEPDLEVAEAVAKA